jgi:hypothetical protein
MQLFDHLTLKRAKTDGNMPAQWRKIRAAIVERSIILDNPYVTGYAMIKHNPCRIVCPSAHPYDKERNEQ